MTSGGRVKGTLQHTVRRACFIGAGACLVTAAVVPGSAAQESDDPVLAQVFHGAAQSLGVQVAIDRDTLLPLPDVFKFLAVEGDSVYETSTQTARASVFYPGNGLINGPALLCGTFGGEFPPEFKPILDSCIQYKYPLTAFADSLHPDESTSGSLEMGDSKDAVSGTAVGAKAHAGLDGTTTNAAVQDLKLLGLPGAGALNIPIPGFEGLSTSIMTIDSATSRTSERFVGDALTVTSTATLSGVDLIGGLVHIGSIESKSIVTDAADGTQTKNATFNVSGVTVATIPAQITDDGLVLGAPNNVLGPLVQGVVSQVNGLLETFGVRMEILPQEESVDESIGSVSARVGGLRIEFARDLSGLPVLPGPFGDLDPNGTLTGTIILGGTGADAIAANFNDDIVELPVDPLPGDGFVPDDGGFVPDESVDSPSDVGEQPSDGQADVPDPVQRVVSFVDELFADRLRLLYLAFTLAAFGLCVAPRLTLPARLPGGQR